MFGQQTYVYVFMFCCSLWVLRGMEFEHWWISACRDKLPALPGHAFLFPRYTLPQWMALLLGNPVILEGSRCQRAMPVPAVSGDHSWWGGSPGISCDRSGSTANGPKIPCYSGWTLSQPQRGPLLISHISVLWGRCNAPTAEEKHFHLCFILFSRFHIQT